MAKSRRAATATTSSATPASNLKSSKSASATKHSSTKPETPSRNPSFDTEFELPDRVGGQDHDPASEVSSPAASIDHHVDGTKVMDGTSPTMSESEDDHDETATVNTSESHPQKGHYRLPSLSLSEYAGEQEAADPQYDYHQPISPTEDPESQWESDTGGGFHHHKRGGSDAKSMTSSSTPGSAARPRKSGPPGSQMCSRPSRQSTNFSKTNLSPNSVRRHTNNYFNSRASSASYSEMMGGVEERKAPLVLLHMSLILLPGAEEPILRKITPTMLQRGLLIEHPRSDYQLLEELIFDALGLDEPFDDKNGSDSEAEDKELSEAAAWEKSMGIRRVDGRDKWELRIYASNGLMTAGAWRKVWNEMERIDVEVGPRDWRGQTTDDLLREFARLSSRQKALSEGTVGEFEDDRGVESERTEPGFDYQYRNMERPSFMDAFTVPTSLEGRVRWAAIALLAGLFFLGVGGLVSSTMSRSWRRNSFDYDYPVFSAKTERYIDHIDRFAAAAKNGKDDYVRVIMMNPDPSKITTSVVIASSAHPTTETALGEDAVTVLGQDEHQLLHQGQDHPNAGDRKKDGASGGAVEDQAVHPPPPNSTGQPGADIPAELAHEGEAPAEPDSSS